MPLASRVLLLDQEESDRYSALLRERAPCLQVVALTDDLSADNYPSVWLGAPSTAASLLPKRKPDWLQLTWAGFAPLLDPQLPRDYFATRAISVFGEPMLEYVLFHLLEHERRACLCRENQSRFIWNQVTAGAIAGKTVLIAGLGSIGQHIAQQLSQLGLKVIGVQKTPQEFRYIAEVAGLDRLHELAADADYVVSVLPDTSTTRDIYDRDFFQAMKSTGVFINIGRGSAVVDKELVFALEQGEIAGAVLDVFRIEPLPPSHQFWVTPGLTLTPHIAGPTDPSRMVDLFLSNLSLFQSGQPLNGLIDFNRDY